MDKLPTCMYLSVWVKCDTYVSRLSAPQRWTDDYNQNKKVMSTTKHIRWSKKQVCVRHRMFGKKTSRVTWDFGKSRFIQRAQAYNCDDHHEFIKPTKISRKQKCIHVRRGGVWGQGHERLCACVSLFLALSRSLLLSVILSWFLFVCVKELSSGILEANHIILQLWFFFRIKMILKIATQRPMDPLGTFHTHLKQTFFTTKWVEPGYVLNIEM